MKHTIAILLTLVMLSACKTKTTQIVKSGITSSFHQLQTFKTIIDGDWYESKYIASLRETKSPNKSQQTLALVVELNIDTNKIIGDSILEIGAPSIHEGTSFDIHFRPGSTSMSIPISLREYADENSSFELGYNIANGDTTLLLTHLSKDKQLIEKIDYHKCPKNSEGALQYMVNKTLFAGDFKTTDSSGNKLSLSFSNDGKLTGLKDFQKYYVLTDFEGSPEMTIDEICFDIQTKNQQCYAFKIKGDTINLYNANDGSEATRQLGTLKYTMIREH